MTGSSQVWEKALTKEPKGLGSAQNAEIVVYMEILTARLGSSPFVTLRDLEQTTALSHPSLQKILENLETHGRIESVRVNDEEVYYFAVF